LSDMGRCGNNQVAVRPRERLKTEIGDSVGGLAKHKGQTVRGRLEP